MLGLLLLYSHTSKDLICLMSAWHRSTGISSCHPSSRWQELFVATQPRDGTVWNNLNKYTFSLFFPFNTSSRALSTPHFPILFNVKAPDILLGRDWVKSLVARWPAEPLIRQIGGGAGRSGDEGLPRGAWIVLTDAAVWLAMMTSNHRLVLSTCSSHYKSI